MEKATPKTSQNSILHILASTGLTEPRYNDLKSRTTSLLNDAFKGVYGTWTGYEIFVTGATDGNNRLAFILYGDRSKVDHIDKENIPPLYDLLNGGDSIMIDAMKLQHKYGLKYEGSMTFIDLKNGLMFRLLVAHRIDPRTE